MSIPLRLVDPPDGSYYDAAPGDVWPCPNAGGAHTAPGRGPCWVVRLPGHAYVFHTNMETSEGGFWSVAGEPPNLTVTPSINVGPGLWHGWITDGALSPDHDSGG